MLTDDEFVQAFETQTLPAGAFTHTGHVRAAWWYLRRYPLGDAIDRFRTALRAYAESLRASGKYHETITVTWLLLIEERLGTDARGLGWETFAARHPELFEREALLALYYDRGTLASERARRGFVMPDRMIAS